MDVIENCGGGGWFLYICRALDEWCVCIVNDIECKFASGPSNQTFILFTFNFKLESCARVSSHSSACITISMTISHIRSGVAHSFPLAAIGDGLLYALDTKPYAQFNHLGRRDGDGVTKWTKEPLAFFRCSFARTHKHFHIGQTKRVATFPIHQIFTLLDIEVKWWNKNDEECRRYKLKKRSAHVCHRFVGFIMTEHLWANSLTIYDMQYNGDSWTIWWIAWVISAILLLDRWNIQCSDLKHGTGREPKKHNTTIRFGWNKMDW